MKKTGFYKLKIIMSLLVQEIIRHKRDLSYQRSEGNKMKKLVICMLVAGLFSCSCSDDSPQKNEGSQKNIRFAYTEFQNERAAWERQNIDCYRYRGEYTSNRNDKEFLSNNYRLQYPLTVIVFPDKEPDFLGKKRGWTHPFIMPEATTITEIYAYYEDYYHNLEKDRQAGVISSIAYSN